MNAKAILSVTGMVTVGLLTACSTSGRKISQTDVQTIQVGDDKQMVQTRIGAPDRINTSKSGETWKYDYRRSSPNAKRFIPLLGTFIGGKNVETQTISVVFDQTGRVADVQTEYGGTDAKGRPVTTTSESATSTSTTTTP